MPGRWPEEKMYDGFSGNNQESETTACFQIKQAIFSTKNREKYESAKDVRALLPPSPGLAPMIAIRPMSYTELLQANSIMRNFTRNISSYGGHNNGSPCRVIVGSSKGLPRPTSLHCDVKKEAEFFEILKLYLQQCTYGGKGEEDFRVQTPPSPHPPPPKKNRFNP